MTDILSQEERYCVEFERRWCQQAFECGQYKLYDARTPLMELIAIIDRLATPTTTASVDEERAEK